MVAPIDVFANPRRGTPGLVVLPAGGWRRARATIVGWEGYAPTPLVDLPEVAAQAGVGTVRIKDESGRFGLGSFKALGGAYAVDLLLRMERSRRGLAPDDASAAGSLVVTCATDGNHGRAVAWGARRAGCRCVVFVHEGVSAARAEAIAAYGAEIRRVPGTYDDSVRTASAVAEAQGWFVVSDTSWPGYTGVPADVMQGYRLMPDEAADQWEGAPPTHVFVQAGVGGVAAAVSVQARLRWPGPPLPALIVVEPDRAACLLASARAGERLAIGGALDTIMAGLACGEPSLLAWQELERAAAAFVAIPDAAALSAMRVLAGAGVVSGESGAAGLAALLAAGADPAARNALGLTPASRVLLFSTEGATDPDLYDRVMAGASPVLTPG
jgi:diaminopropionate ammonia-lyase